MASKRAKRQVKKVAKEVVKKYPVVAIVLAVVILALAIGGYFIYRKLSEKPTVGDLSFHFMTLGNSSPGDSIYVKAGDVDILIDAGSTTGSVPIIQNYVDQYCKDGVLEYVIVTHADTDHIAGFAASVGIFELYECQTIIDFPLTDKDTDAYNDYIAKRDKEVQNGAVRYSALECYNQTNGAKREYQLAESISFEVLYNTYYEKSHADENNYSVCVMFHHGSKNFLFTGDLEEAGEKELVKNNTLGKVELFKAGHHGSATSSNTELLDVIDPEICVVSCVAGDNKYNFPRQDFINRIAICTTKVYVTMQKTDDGFADLNGNVIVSSGNDGVKVDCSADSKVLKDTEWFRDNRQMPLAWSN